MIWAGAYASCVQNKGCQQCTRCCDVHYCDKRCQRADWARHKVVCVPAGPVINQEIVFGSSVAGLNPGLSCLSPDRDSGHKIARIQIKKLLYDTSIANMHSRVSSLVSIMSAHATAPQIIVRMEPAMPDIIHLLTSKKARFMSIGAHAAMLMFAAHAGIRERWRAVVKQACCA